MWFPNHCVDYVLYVIPQSLRWLQQLALRQKGFDWASQWRSQGGALGAPAPLFAHGSSILCNVSLAHLKLRRSLRTALYINLPHCDKIHSSWCCILSACHARNLYYTSAIALNNHICERTCTCMLGFLQAITNCFLWSPAHCFCYSQRQETNEHEGK